jgi:hypothetical protein
MWPGLRAGLLLAVLSQVVVSNDFHACAGEDLTSIGIHSRYVAWHNEQLSKRHICGTRKALIWYPVAGIGDASARLAKAYQHAVLGGWLLFVRWDFSYVNAHLHDFMRPPGEHKRANKHKHMNPQTTSVQVSRGS